MDRAHIVRSAVVAQTVAAVNAYTCMTVFTVLELVEAAGLTVVDNRLGRLIGYGAPGAREVAADTICRCIGCHMLGQLRLGIYHVDMTLSTVCLGAGTGIDRISKVVMTRLRLNMRVADAVERWVEASVVAIIVAGRTQ